MSPAAGAGGAGGAAGAATTTRDRILRAAEHVVLRQGVARLTLEAAARQAGLSKGGVLYHFPTRDALVTAMVERVIDHYNDEIQRAERSRRGPGSFIRAYVAATFDETPDRDHQQSLGAALVAAIAAEPSLLEPMRAESERWQARIERDGLSPARATAVRLAADGLWLSELFGLVQLSPELRQAVAEELDALARMPARSSRPSNRVTRQPSPATRSPAPDPRSSTTASRETAATTGPSSAASERRRSRGRS